MDRWRIRVAMDLVCILTVNVFALTGCVQAEKSDVIIIRIIHDNSVSAPLHKAFLKFKDLVETRSEGCVEVVIFPGEQMSSVQDTSEQCRRRDIEVSGSTTSNFIRTMPEFAAWESFYMFDDTTHAKRVFESEARKKVMEPLKRMNLTGTGYMELDFHNFSNSKCPIRTSEDLKGLKIRGYNPLQIKAWESVGVNTTSVSRNELFTSLQQRLIDGQECATTSFYTEEFYEVQKYWSLTRHVFTNFLWYANEDFMNSLSDSDRAFIMEGAQEAIDYNWGLMDQSEEGILKQPEDAGFSVNDVDISVRRQLGEKINALIKGDIIASCGEDTYNILMAAVAAERREQGEE